MEKIKAYRILKVNNKEGVFGMSLRERLKKYIDKVIEKEINKHSCFYSNEQLSEEEIKELLEKIDMAFPIK